jgi:molecular chaperone HtpG
LNSRGVQVCEPADLAQIPRLDAKNEPQQETDAAMATFLAFAKTARGEAVADVRISDRLTDSAVCLVAAEHGPDRQFERLLAGAGRIASAAKPILEVNPRHIVGLVGLSPDARAVKDDAVHLLFDEARVLDGERPADARNFSDRLAQVLERGLGRV